MTIEELILKVVDLSESVVLWFSSGFETLRNGEWLQLTIGQGIFAIFAGLFALVYISILCEQLMNRKIPEPKPGSNGWDDQ